MLILLGGFSLSLFLIAAGTVMKGREHDGGGWKVALRLSAPMILMNVMMLIYFTAPLNLPQNYRELPFVISAILIVMGVRNFGVHLINVIPKRVEKYRNR